MKNFYLIAAMISCATMLWNCGDDSSSGTEVVPDSSSEMSSEAESSSSEVESSSSEAVSSESGPTIKDRGFINVVSKYPVPALPSIAESGTSGWLAAYWSSCKPYCSQPDKILASAYETSVNVARTCSIHDYEIPAFALKENVAGTYSGVPDACEKSGSTNGGFMCTDMSPVAVNDTLSYAFAAASPASAACGKCFHLQLDGGTHAFDGDSEEGSLRDAHKAVANKHIVVMAVELGVDMDEGEFDLLIPGAGHSVYDALATVAHVSEDDLGVMFGGFSMEFRQTNFDYEDDELRAYILQKCETAFGENENLLAGCKWQAEWLMGAYFPTYKWQEVECPQYLIDKYASTINTAADNMFKQQPDWSVYKPGDVVESIQ